MRTAPYGTWRSPITPRLITAEQVGLASPWLDGGSAWWTESRPLEGGRVTLMRRRAGSAAVEVTPAPFNLRTRVHEYGGRAFAASGDLVVGSAFADQRLWRLDGTPRALTPASDAALRYAEPVLDARRGRVLAVREDHRGRGEPRNELVAVPLEGEPDEGAVLDGRHDFVAYPRPSPDGRRLAWVSWDHPDMPWDGTSLWVAELDARGLPAEPLRVAGGCQESVLQPEWAADGTLYFLSDRSGWWNLHRWRGGDVEAVCPMEAELGGPLWQLGARWYELQDERTGVGIVTRGGLGELVRLDLEAGTATRLELPFVDYAGVSGRGERVLVQALAAEAAAALILLEPATGRFECLASAGELALEPGYVARPEPVSFASAGGRLAHALYYAPTNATCRAEAGERPPLIVRSHGGPTGRASPALNLQIQFWTSRGFAVVDVDYGGSTGYGRAYRQLLDGQWGIVDVEDCIAATRHLVAAGKADPARLAIRGGSAGGYTTLCALTFHEVFQAGASSYGVGDLESLARDTHKFESRYLDRLVGPWPDAGDLYRARSPLHHVDRLARPVIFLQGQDDKVVPPNQAELMVEALRRKGLPVAYIAFAGRGARLPQGGDDRGRPRGRAGVLLPHLRDRAGGTAGATGDREPSVVRPPGRRSRCCAPLTARPRRSIRRLAALSRDKAIEHASWDRVRIGPMGRNGRHPPPADLAHRRREPDRPAPGRGSDAGDGRAGIVQPRDRDGGRIRGLAGGGVRAGAAPGGAGARAASCGRGRGGDGAADLGGGAAGGGGGRAGARAGGSGAGLSLCECHPLGAGCRPGEWPGQGAAGDVDVAGRGEDHAGGEPCRHWPRGRGGCC